jgi:hypothetical protein
MYTQPLHDGLCVKPETCKAKKEKYITEAVHCVGCCTSVADRLPSNRLNQLDQCFPTAGPWHQLYRAARGKYFIVEIFLGE